MSRPAFIITLGALGAASALTVDICIPAQGRIATDFRTAPGAGAALISTYFLGWGAGQLFWGPLSNRFGRRRPLFIALATFVIASIACALAPAFEALLAARLVQGSRP